MDQLNMLKVNKCRLLNENLHFFAWKSQSFILLYSSQNCEENFYWSCASQSSKHLDSHLFKLPSSRDGLSEVQKSCICFQNRASLFWYLHEQIPLSDNYRQVCYSPSKETRGIRNSTPWGLTSGISLNKINLWATRQNWLSYPIGWTAKSVNICAKPTLRLNEQGSSYLIKYLKI